MGQRKGLTVLGEYEATDSPANIIDARGKSCVFKGYPGDVSAIAFTNNKGPGTVTGITIQVDLAPKGE